MTDTPAPKTLRTLPDLARAGLIAPDALAGLEAVAAQLGITLEEAQAHMDAMLAELEAAGVSMPAIDPARVHRLQ